MSIVYVCACVPHTDTHQYMQTQPAVACAVDGAVNVSASFCVGVCACKDVNGIFE